MNLYTSLTRLKMSMNGGQLPPMTPLTEEAQLVVDPAFTIGMGAIVEDVTKGLRCPVVGCGKYFHVLRNHLRRSHADVGGDKGVLSALDIPESAILTSRTLHETRSAKSRRDYVPGHLHAGGRVQSKKRRRRKIMTTRTVAWRNLRDQCDAQMRNKMLDVHHAVGRSPSFRDAVSVAGEAWVKSVIHTYGTWNAAKARFGLEQYQRGQNGRAVSLETTLEGLRAYHNAHGTLPSVRHARSPTRTPLIPAVPTILRSMGAESWNEAMCRAAALLNIYGGRYGLPERARGVA